jgi:hypothetical protein
MKKIIIAWLVIKYITLATTPLFGADFNSAFVRTIQYEGVAFTAFKWDNDGGGTKYGFTLKRYKQIAKTDNSIDPVTGKRYIYDVNGDGVITATDLRKVKIKTIKHLYKKYYWDAVGGDKIHNQLLAESFYDYLVNGGLSTRKIQSIIGVKQDGKLGAKTFEAINDPKNICSHIKKTTKSRANWLFVVMKKARPTTYKLCKIGWSNRLNKFVQQYNSQCNEKLPYYRV